MASLRLRDFFAAPSAVGDIKPLTGVRGVAAFVVMLYHYSNYMFFPSFNPPELHKGYLCVDLFFVLSGFVLALRYGDKFKIADWRDNYWPFLQARIARIYPAYFLISILYYAKWVLNVSGTNTEAFTPFDLIMNALVVQGWGFPVRAIVSDSWSVSVEFFAYMIFPILILVTNGAPRIVALISLLFAAFALDSVALCGLGVNGPMDVVSGGLPIMALVRCIGSFTMGLVAFRFANLPEVRRLLASQASVAAVLALIALSLWLDQWDVFTAMLFPCLVIALFHKTYVGSLLFGNRVIHHLGDVSFSLYLLHPFFIGVAGHYCQVYATRLGPTGQYLFVALGVAATWATSYLVFRLVELPGRRMVRLLARRA